MVRHILMRLTWLDLCDILGEFLLKVASVAVHYLRRPAKKMGAPGVLGCISTDNIFHEWHCTVCFASANA